MMSVPVRLWVSSTKPSSTDGMPFRCLLIETAQGCFPSERAFWSWTRPVNFNRFFLLRGELPILCKDMRNYCTAVCRKFGTADDFSFEGFVVGVELGCTNVSHHVANFDGLIYCAPT